jgi:hypothetical protein
VWFVKLFKQMLVGKTTRADFLEVTAWALVSLLVSACWRIGTDNRTLATGQVAGTPFTKKLLYLERGLCVLVLACLLVVVGAGEVACAKIWIITGVYAIYLMFPAYMVVGLLIHGHFNDDRASLRRTAQID